MPRKAKKKKDEPMKKTLVILAALFCLLLLPGCSQKSKLCNQIQDAIAEENLDDLRITVYFMDPDVTFRAYPTLEQLTSPNNEWVTVYHLEGRETYDSIQVIQNQLRPDGIELIEQTKSSHVNARVYYILENKRGEKILELLVGGTSPGCLLLNGVPVAYNAVFYDIIHPCIGFQAEDLWQYFGSVVEPPKYEHKPSEYPNSVWVCKDPKITLYVQEDGSIVCKFGETSDSFASDTLLGGFEPFSNEFWVQNNASNPPERQPDDPETTARDYFECRCEFSPEKMTAVVTRDELFDGKYVGQQIVFVRKEG